MGTTPMTPRRLLGMFASRVFSTRTIAMMKFDLSRRRARKKQRQCESTPVPPSIHFGCDDIRVPGWLNVDVAGSDCDVDLAGGSLPWMDSVVDAAVGEHVIEHLDLKSELLPLLREFKRVLKEGGELWVSCPDIDKLCHSYVDNTMKELIDDRERRSQLHWSYHWTLDGETGLNDTPPSQMINSIFYQNGQHRNLFDHELLDWTLRLAGFETTRQVTEEDLLARFPEFPRRDDSRQAIYMRAIA